MRIIARLLLGMSVLGGKPPRALIPPGLFEHLRRRDIPVFFLGVNDESDIEVRESELTAVSGHG